jgi:hypothetical protein
MSTKPLIIAALAATTAFAGIAFAQQATPANPSAPAQVQAPQNDEEIGEDARPPRLRDGEDRWDRDRHSSDDRDRMGPPRGMMMRRGPGMMMGLCGPNGGRFAERMIDRIERATRPTEQQKPAFDKLKDAATKAAETAKAGCPTEPSLTPPGRLANAEKRLTAMLDAIRTLRPAMDAYYGSLSDEQKARLLMSRRAMMDRPMGPMMGPMGDRHGWRGGPERGEPRDSYRNPDRSEQRDNYRNPDRDDYRDRRPERGDDEPRRNRYDRTGSNIEDL